MSLLARGKAAVSVWWSTSWARLLAWAATRRGGLDILVVVVGVIATGLASLVLEDLLPTDGCPKVLFWRATSAVMSIALLVWLLAVRRTLRRRFGTLYYLFGLPASMADRHAGRMLGESPRYQTYRIVRMKADPGPDQAVHSVALADRMNDAMNQDDVETGFHLAPNVLWDLAMGVGGQLAGRPGLGLVELDGALVRWTQSPPTKDWPFAGLVTRDATLPPSATGFPAIIINLAQAEPSWPENWPISHAVSIGVFDADGSGPSPVRVAPTPERSSATVHPWHAVEEVVKTICDMVHAQPGGPVLILGRMPKTVALSIGMHLDAQHRPICGVDRCAHQGCHDPWTVLTPLRVDQSTWKTYDYIRVHPSQPSPEAMEKRRVRALSAVDVERPTTVVNLTPHDVTIYRAGQVVATVVRQGEVARLVEEMRDRPPINTVHGALPVKALGYTGEVASLPAPEPGTVFVVSRLTAQAVNRSDLLFPGGEVRDESHRVIGCAYLAMMNRDAGRG